MKKVSQKVLEVIERVARTEIAKNTNSTFPFCVGFFYQPMRPKTISKKN